jgi:hypothetical protein
MKLKKGIIVLIVSLICSISVYGQKQKNFRERQFLILNNEGKYLTYKKDSTIFLHQKKKVGKTVEKIHFSVTNEVTTQYYKEVDSFKVDTFNISNFPRLKKPRFKGDFKMEKNQLHFYPWDFKKDSLLNDQLEKYSFYIPIPNRTVLKVKFYSFQYGILTLPAKIYLKSKSDSLVSNIQTGVNLNLMLGFKWGYKKYSYLPNKKEGTIYESACSINWIFGISKVDLSETNTTPAINDSYSVGIISNGIAFGYQYRSIGIFLVTGVDTPLSKFGKNWDFKHKPWLGLGLGLGL